MYQGCYDDEDEGVIDPTMLTTPTPSEYFYSMRDIHDENPENRFSMIPPSGFGWSYWRGRPEPPEPPTPTRFPFDYLSAIEEEEEEYAGGGGGPCPRVSMGPPSHMFRQQTPPRSPSPRVATPCAPKQSRSRRSSSRSPRPSQRYVCELTCRVDDGSTPRTSRRGETGGLPRPRPPKRRLFHDQCQQGYQHPSSANSPPLSRYNCPEDEWDLQSLIDRRTGCI